MAEQLFLEQDSYILVNRTIRAGRDPFVQSNRVQMLFSPVIFSLLRPLRQPLFPAFPTCLIIIIMPFQIRWFILPVFTRKRFRIAAHQGVTPERWACATMASMWGSFWTKLPERVDDFIHKVHRPVPRHTVRQSDRYPRWRIIHSSTRAAGICLSP